MHAVIVEKLEEYISGSLLPAALQEFVTHLQSCPDCREEVRSMQEVSTLFTTLRTTEEVGPPAGFAERVMRQVAAEPAPSIWSLLSLDPGFGRRVVFACLLTLAVLGSYLVSRETEYMPGPSSPEAIMANEQSPAPVGPTTDRDRMLVTLTTYEP